MCRCHENLTFLLHNASRENFWHLDSIFFFVRQAELAFSEKSRNLSFDPEGLEQSQCQRATSHIGFLILSCQNLTNPLHNENSLLVLLYRYRMDICMFSLASLSSRPF